MINMAILFDDLGHRARLEKGEYVLGTEGSMRVPLDMGDDGSGWGIQPQHAKLVRDSGGWYLANMDGSKVCGLDDRSSFTLGRYHMTLVLDGEGPDQSARRRSRLRELLKH